MNLEDLIVPTQATILNVFETSSNYYQKYLFVCAVLLRFILLGCVSFAEYSDDKNDRTI